MMPETAAYRVHTEKLVSERLALVEKVSFLKIDTYFQTSNISELEKKIDCGQIEEVIIQVIFTYCAMFCLLMFYGYLLFQAKNEYELAKNMLKWKPWEPLVQDAPPNQWKWPM